MKMRPHIRTKYRNCNAIWTTSVYPVTPQCTWTYMKTNHCIFTGYTYCTESFYIYMYVYVPLVIDPLYEHQISGTYIYIYSGNMIMEASPRLVIVALLLVIGIANIVELSSGQSICKVPLNGLMACKPAVTAPNPAPPTTKCCSVLTHADLQCLCSYKNSQLLPSLGIDPNLAMQLPQKCKLPHPANC